MKLVRFLRPDNSIGLGTQTEYGVQDLSAADHSLPTSMVEMISKWPQYESRIASLSKKLGSSSDPLRVICPIDRPGKILCIGLNYRDHAIETNAPIPDEPIVFCKMPTAMIGPNEVIRLPKASTEVDYEAELVAIIGRTVKHATRQQAEEAIFGYTAGHDVSARDWQKGKPGKQWFLGKSFDTFAPLGPAIALAGSVDPTQLKIRCRLNDQLVQDSSTSELIFSPAHLVEYISQVMTLEPGDVIFTGTPAGVGVARTPQLFLHDGDKVEIEIEHIGRLSNPCVNDPG
ncbi:MAG: fumarylacetoacetate hydrolase family protein [Pirellula sp.]|jgi:2-keto-4-pentenoate hydratase/2-oxohepta-3-ene-1,7-dioic acid hydratase in catechol pathway